MNEKRRDDAEHAAPEAAVDSVAVELTGDAAPPRPAPPVPLTIHQPPVRNAPAPAANPIVDVSAAPGATAPSFDGHAHEPPMNPLADIAGDRPELLVGAAFAGGILAAMILRRLGN